jgi:hypothetical protein
MPLKAGVADDFFPDFEGKSVSFRRCSQHGQSGGSDFRADAISR